MSPPTWNHENLIYLAPEQSILRKTGSFLPSDKKSSHITSASLVLDGNGTLGRPISMASRFTVMCGDEGEESVYRPTSPPIGDGECDMGTGWAGDVEVYLPYYVIQGTLPDSDPWAQEEAPCRIGVRPLEEGPKDEQPTESAGGDNGSVGTILNEAATEGE